LLFSLNSFWIYQTYDLLDVLVILVKLNIKFLIKQEIKVSKFFT